MKKARFICLLISFILLTMVFSAYNNNGTKEKLILTSCSDISTNGYYIYDPQKSHNSGIKTFRKQIINGFTPLPNILDYNKEICLLNCATEDYIEESETDSFAYYRNKLFTSSIVNNNKKSKTNRGFQVNFCSIKRTFSFIKFNYNILPNVSSIPILMYFKNAPVICLFVFIMFYYWLKIWDEEWSIQSYGASYKMIVEKNEIWRIFTASFSHGSILHLAFNMSFMISTYELEELWGSFRYFVYTLILSFLTMFLLYYGIYNLLINYFHREEYRSQFGMGISCVLFAYLTYMAQHSDSVTPIAFIPFSIKTIYIHFEQFNLDIPINIAPIITLIFTSILIPQSSFYGHLSGILIGFVLSIPYLRYLTPTAMVSVLFFLYLLYNYLNPDPLFEKTQFERQRIEQEKIIDDSIMYLWRYLLPSLLLALFTVILDIYITVDNIFYTMITLFMIFNIYNNPYNSYIINCLYFICIITIIYIFCYSYKLAMFISSSFLYSYSIIFQVVFIYSISILFLCLYLYIYCYILSINKSSLNPRFLYLFNKIFPENKTRYIVGGNLLSGKIPQAYTSVNTDEVTDPGI